MASEPTKKELLRAATPPHPREGWTAGCDRALVHGKLSWMKGTEDGALHPKAEMAELYATAKFKNDMEAAADICDAMWSADTHAALQARVIASGKFPIIVSPHPSFDDEDAIDGDAPLRAAPRNALPFAYASRLRNQLGGHQNETIVQAARVGRTKLPRFPRFLYQPHFVGDVSTDRPYIIADDNFGLGGTVAALHSHIVGNGGSVLAVTTLAHPTGISVPLALTEGTRAGLTARYGAEFCEFWRKVIGHEPDCLSEAEGEFLLTWDHLGIAGSPDAELHALRTRLDQARAKCE